jgi:hypothetical protein
MAREIRPDRGLRAVRLSRAISGEMYALTCLVKLTLKQMRDNKRKLQQSGNQPCGNTSEHRAGQQIFGHWAVKPPPLVAGKRHRVALIVRCVV